MTRAQRIAKAERFRKRYENKYRGRITAALKSQISSFISDLNNGLSYAQGRLQVDILNERMGRVISDLYTEAGVAKANQVYRELIKSPKVEKGFGFNAEWTRNIIDYFKVHLFDKVVLPISNTTKRMIDMKIAEMIDNGYSIEWLSQQLESSEFTAWRAAMIARTESNRAINYGAELGARSTGFQTKKEWVSLHDPRTRHTHILLDGKVVNDNEEFKPGLAFPGDPNGAAGETINCRCHLEYKAKRDANGRLIPATPVVQRPRRSRELNRIIALLESN